MMKNIFLITLAVITLILGCNKEKIQKESNVEKSLTVNANFSSLMLYFIDGALNEEYYIHIE